MYMFFWFFKQFYYCLRRIFKSGILLLLLFFIAFLLLSSKVFATEYGVPCHKCDHVSYMNTTYDITNNTGYDTDKHLSNMLLLQNNGDIYLCFMYFTSGTHADNYLYIKNGLFRSTYDYSITIFKYNTSTQLFDWYNWTGAEWWNNNMTWLGTVSNNTILGASTDIYTDNTYTNVYYSTVQVNDPYIVNNDTDVEAWNFDYLRIYAGDYTNNSSCWLDFTYPNSNIEYSIDISSYYITDNGIGYWAVPKSLIQQDIVVRTDSTFTFDLVVRTSIEGGSTVNHYTLGSYTLDITSQVQQDTNEDSNKQLLGDISSNQQETNEKLDNIENTITNDNVADSSIYLPQDNSNDITADGLNSIFTSIYNAFCTGTAQDIVFPIPFTNKNITLQPNYVRSMLTNNNATWIITIIEAFWWYLISRFIIKDITNKITKIKSGNIENIEKSNIKGDML